jgi:hypothetical protein
MSQDVTLRYLIFGEDRSASKAIQGTATKAERAASAVSRSVGKIGSAIGGPVGDLLGRVSEGIDEVVASSGKFSTKMIAGGAAVAGLGAAMSMFGSENVEAENRIKQAIEATGEGLDKYAGRIDALVSANQRLGISDDETKGSLAALTQQTGSADSALQYMGLAADLAASKHMSLQGATDLIGRALNGNTRIFKQYGVEAPKGPKDVGRAMDELSAKLSGTAAAATDTYAGKIKGLKTGLVDTAAELSAKFGPALQAAGAIAMVTGTIMQIYAARQAAAATATEAGTAATIGSRIAMVATSAATKTMAAAQWLLNAALSANPIGLVVIAIAALVAGLIYAYQHSATFRAIVQGAMKAVGAAISWLWDNAAKPALHALGAAWKWLVKVITPAVKFIITAVAGLLHMWAQMLRGLSNVPGFEWAKKAATAMDRAAERALALARALGKLHDKKVTVTYFQKVVGSAQGGKNAAEIAGLQQRAKGGPVDRRTAYVIGEEGPEVYVPKSDGMVLPNEVYRNMVSGGRPIRSERTSFTASTQHDTIEVVVKTEDGRVIQQKLLKRKRELGGAVLGLA